MPRKARRVLSFDLGVDERTSQMSEEALYCRKRGHKWGEKGITRKRYTELLAQGLWEDSYYCENGCGGTWRLVWSLRTGEVLEKDRRYPTGGDYLMPRGSGRLSRNEARIAHAARRIPAYA